MFKFISSRIWLVTVLFSLVVTVYGYVADGYVTQYEWGHRLYNFHFVSIRVQHIGVVTLFVTLFTCAGLIFETFKIKNRFIIVFKTIVAIGILGISLWYQFDAGKRVFQTIPELKDELGFTFTTSQLSTIYWMTIWETFASFILIICSYKMILNMLGKNHKVTIPSLVNHKVLKVIRRIARTFGIAIALSSLFAFIVIVASNRYELLTTPYRAFGPLVNLMLFVICTFAWTAVINFYNNEKNVHGKFRIKNHSTAVLILFVLAGMVGYAFHETLVLVDNNLVDTGFYGANNSVILLTAGWSLMLSLVLIGLSLLMHTISIVIYTLAYSK